MPEKIKEILDKLKYIVDFPIIEHDTSFNSDNVEESVCLLISNECKLLLDYITNLQEELEISKDKAETYRLEMQEITKIFGLDEHTLFDDVKEYATNLQQEINKLTAESTEWESKYYDLQQENERLKEKINNLEMFKYNIPNDKTKTVPTIIKSYKNEYEDYKSRCEKANKIITDFMCTEEYCSVDPIAIAENYMEIQKALNGSDNND